MKATENKSLIPMVEYVLQTDEYGVKIRLIEDIFKYANFLSQPPTLGMFVTVGKNGEVLVEPREYEEWLYLNENDAVNYSVAVSEKCLEYKQAQSAVVFEGFELYDKRFIYNKETNLKIPIWNLAEKTIEYLIDFNLPLTPFGKQCAGFID